MKKKAKLPLEFVIEARTGDAILNRIVEEQVDYLVKIGVSVTAGAHLRNVLKSNVFISKIMLLLLMDYLLRMMKKNNDST